MESRIKEDLAEGNYVIAGPQPHITSALAAIEKNNGDIRLIHDFSRPEDNSVNDFAFKDSCKYQSLDNAIELLTPHSYMAKVDLKSAYRSVEIKPEQYTLTGLRWKFNGEDRATNIIDRCLGFGARKAPSIFNRITQSVARMMHRRSFNCIVYLDDFFLCENSFSRCLEALSTLVQLLRSLNFKINWQKITDPCRRTNFLGVEIDLDKEQLSWIRTKQLPCATTYRKQP